METTERVVEAYLRYVKRCATIPNIRCDGQHEIDLLAIELNRGERYHVECSVSISGSYRNLTNKEYSEDLYKLRVQKPKMRRTLGYFVERKFNPEAVLKTLTDFGFEKGKYKRVIVTWSTDNDAKTAAKELGVEIWEFPNLLSDLVASVRGTRHYFTDDTVRTLHLMDIALAANRSPKSVASLSGTL